MLRFSHPGNKCVLCIPYGCKTFKHKCKKACFIVSIKKSGSKYPKNILLNFQKGNTGSVSFSNVHFYNTIASKWIFANPRTAWELNIVLTNLSHVWTFALTSNQQIGLLCTGERRLNLSNVQCFCFGNWINYVFDTLIQKEIL